MGKAPRLRQKDPVPQAKYDALWDEENKEIPTKKSIQKGKDTLEIGDYFKVKNKDYWQYYLKTSGRQVLTCRANLPKHKEKDRDKWKETDGSEKTVNVKNKASDGNDDPNLKEGDYFKVKNGAPYKYYQKTSAKGTRKIPSSVALNFKLRRNDEADRFVEKGDYMDNVITSSSLPEKVQENDIANVENDPKFSISQLRRSASVFKSLVNLKWVKKSATNVIGGAETSRPNLKQKKISKQKISISRN